MMNGPYTPMNNPMPNRLAASAPSSAPSASPAAQNYSPSPPGHHSPPESQKSNGRILPSASPTVSSASKPKLGVWDAEKMLHSYVHDFLIKKNYHQAAGHFSHEAQLGPEGSSVPIDIPGGFLMEWWSVFWDVFSARSNQPATSEACSYSEMVAIKNEFEKKQKLLHQQILHQQAYVQQQQSIAAVIGKQQQPSSQYNPSASSKTASAAFAEAASSSALGNSASTAVHAGQMMQPLSSEGMSLAFGASEPPTGAKEQQESYSQTKDLDSLNLEEKRIWLSQLQNQHQQQQQGMLAMAGHSSPAQPANMRPFSGQIESMQHASPAMNPALPVPSPLISMRDHAESSSPTKRFRSDVAMADMGSSLATSISQPANVSVNSPYAGSPANSMNMQYQAQLQMQRQRMMLHQRGVQAPTGMLPLNGQQMFVAPAGMVLNTPPPYHSPMSPMVGRPMMVHSPVGAGVMPVMMQGSSGPISDYPQPAAAPTSQGQQAAQAQVQAQQHQTQQVQQQIAVMQQQQKIQQMRMRQQQQQAMMQQQALQQQQQQQLMQQQHQPSPQSGLQMQQHGSPIEFIGSSYSGPAPLGTSMRMPQSQAHLHGPSPIQQGLSMPPPSGYHYSPPQPQQPPQMQQPSQPHPPTVIMNNLASVSTSALAASSIAAANGSIGNGISAIGGAASNGGPSAASHSPLSHAPGAVPSPAHILSTGAGGGAQKSPDARHRGRSDGPTASEVNYFAGMGMPSAVSDSTDAFMDSIDTDAMDRIEETLLGDLDDLFFGANEEEELKEHSSSTDKTSKASS